MSDTTKTKPELVRDLIVLRERLEAAEAEAARCRKEAASLEGSDERFRKIFDHSNDGIFLVDPIGDEILDVNARACSMLGYPREELLSVPMSVIHPSEMERMRAFAGSVFKKGAGWTNELSCLTKRGATLSAEISASMVELDGRKCMVAMVRDISERDRLTRENEYLIDEIRSELRYGMIIGNSAAMGKVLEQIEMVAKTDAGVLISGESGTGKELIARSIHEQSSRSSHPLVRVNCPSIPAELFESEFFGHVKGAFTGAAMDRDGRFQLADQGTLFLDEVGEIPLELQSKLLRVLQEGQLERVGESRTREVDVRIIAATNRDLLDARKEGRFRQDLYYRLSIFPIEVPPLRERREDIPQLAEHFVGQSSERIKVPRAEISREQMRRLETYDWPGNIRELQNVIERAVIVGRGRRLEFDLQTAEAGRAATDGLSGGAGRRARSAGGLQGGSPGNELTPETLTLEDVKRLEREIILRALDRSGWKIYGDRGAAALLGLKPTTLSSRLKKMGIEKPGTHPAGGCEPARL